MRDFFVGLFEQLPQYHERYKAKLIPPILRAQPHTDGKFAFDEFFDETLVATAMKFNRYL